MSVLLDARPHAAAIRAAITAAMGADGQAWDYDDIPGGLQTATADDRNEPWPDVAAIVSVERRLNERLRMTAQAGSAGWRAAVRCLGRTVDECRGAQWYVAQALNEQRLTIDGRLTTPIQFETDSAPIWDDQRYVADVFYTYAH